MDVISDSVAALETCVGQEGLRVEFFRRDDRYAHQIWRVRRSVRAELLLQSVEGPEGPDADCLPALQGLNIEQLPGGVEAAALIGMSGANHWSLTVEPQLCDGMPTVVFDAACRVRTAPPRLISRYLVEAGLQIDAVGQQIALAAASACRLQAAACSIAGAVDARLTARDRQIDVTQAIPASDSKGQTIRWKYAIALALS